jgi:hypothetical protein
MLWHQCVVLLWNAVTCVFLCVCGTLQCSYALYWLQTCSELAELFVIWMVRTLRVSWSCHDKLWMCKVPWRIRHVDFVPKCSRWDLGWYVFWTRKSMHNNITNKWYVGCMSWKWLFRTAHLWVPLLFQQNIAKSQGVPRSEPLKLKKAVKVFERF